MAIGVVAWRTWWKHFRAITPSKHPLGWRMVIRCSQRNNEDASVNYTIRNKKNTRNKLCSLGRTAIFHPTNNVRLTFIRKGSSWSLINYRHIGSLTNAIEWRLTALLSKHFWASSLKYNRLFAATCHRVRKESKRIVEWRALMFSVVLTKLASFSDHRWFIKPG